MNYSEEDMAVRMPYAHVKDLVTGTEYQQGDELKLKDWDVCVLQEL